jgi:hypothetical protein
MGFPDLRALSHLSMEKEGCYDDMKGIEWDLQLCNPAHRLTRMHANRESLDLSDSRNTII